MRHDRAARPGSAGRSGATALLVGLLALGGCASSSPGGAEPRAAQAEPVLHVGELSTDSSTTLSLDPALMDELSAAGVLPVARSGASLSGRVLTLPVTGGRLEVFDKHAVSPYVRGRVEHARSGLTLGRAGTEVSFDDLVMLPGRSLVTGAVAGTRADLLVLDGSTLQPLRREDGRPVLDGIRVSLLPVGAARIRQALGLSSSQLPDGVFLGTAKLTVAGPP